MKHLHLAGILGLVLFSAHSSTQAAESPARCLPGELSAEDVLNGKYPYPPSPEVPVSLDTEGLAKECLTPVPAPGVHPRVLISPEDLPGLRKRLKETETGRALFANLESRLKDILQKPGSVRTRYYEKLSSGDLAGARDMLLNDPNRKELTGGIGHYQFFLTTTLGMESLAALITQDEARGKKVGTALATYAEMITPIIENIKKGELGDDVFRARPANLPPEQRWVGDDSIKTLDGAMLGIRDLMGYQQIGYAYDFAYNFMTDAQRAKVRKAISAATTGEVWLGARLPHHFRNWNWVAIGLHQPLLSLAIEGEEGFDPRPYKLGVQIAHDYLTYGISEKGSSTEAVGYTQFGLVWANPFIVAASRRGDNLLAHSHHRRMLDWYVQAMEPFGGAWLSHGDGGDSGPAIWTLSMWNYFYPKDPRVAVAWNSLAKARKDKWLGDLFHIIEPVLWADDAAPKSAATPAELKQPLTWFDATRSSLIARTGWNADSAVLQFECRTDSVGASHEHADRGAFTFSALGRNWAKDNFRSIETRHHNSILIDGYGQGYWPGPGKWLGWQDSAKAVIAACDVKEAYDWWWPKQIVTEDPKGFIRFQFARWAGYAKEAEDFRQHHPGLKGERDPRPSVVQHWKGFEFGDARMWDEDGWPVRFPHNPVQRAFRTVAFSRGEKPWLLVVDDIQKDDKEHLYEWLMQTGPNTEIAALKSNDIILCDATVKRDENGKPQPAKGDRQLLVRVLDMNDPSGFHAYQSRPSFRLETFERKDTLEPQVKDGKLAGSRSFDTDKRLVIASRSVAPDFKILLYPIKAGEALPITTWNETRTQLVLESAGKKQVVTFTKDKDGKNVLQVSDSK